MDNKPIIWSVIEEVAREQDKAMLPLSDDLQLIDSGLDSLCFAIIVARLEDKFGVDPFNSAKESFPITFGDFIKFYQ